MKFLNLDSPLMRFLSRMTDLLWLNVLTLICVILVIPAGAAFTALHYVCLKMVRDEEGYITKDFIKSFKTNFLQATAIWLMLLAIVVFFIIDLKCVQFVSHPMIVVGTILGAAVFVLITALYVFPILARFSNTIKGTIKNAFFMSILALPKTVLMILLALAPAAIIFVVEYFQAFAAAIPLTILFCFSAPAYFSAKLYSETFKRFEPEPEKVVVDDFAWTVSAEPEDGAEAADVETQVTEINSDKVED